MPIMSDRNALLQKLAEHYEQRACDADEFARRYGHLQAVSTAQLQAQAMAFREAAAYAHQQKEG